MVEIKRKPSGQSYINKPIGVVNVTTNSERAALESAKNYSSFADSMFQKSASMQKEAAAEFANQAVVIDESGKVVSQKIPFSLGGVGRDVAAKELDRRMLVASREELTNAALDAKARSQGNIDTYRQNFETYLAQREEDFKKSGGVDFIPKFKEMAHGIGYKAELKMRLDRQEQINEQDAISFNSSITNYSNEIYQSALSGDFENAKKILAESTGLNSTSTLITGRKREDNNSALQKAMKLGVARSVFIKAGPTDAARLYREVRANTWSEKTLQENPELRNVSLGVSEWNSTGTWASNYLTGTIGSLKAEIAKENFERTYDEGRANDTDANRTELDDRFGYSNMSDTYMRPIGAYAEENNGQFAAKQTVTMANMLVNGQIPEQDLDLALDRLTNAQAAQEAAGKSLVTWLGSTTGPKVQSMVTAYNTARKVGGDEFARVVYQRGIEINSGSTTELMNVIAKKAEYTIDKEKTDLANINAAAIKAINELEIPADFRDQLKPVAKYFLSVPELDFKEAIDSYLFSAWNAAGQFYETEGGYSKFAFSPEYYLDNNAQSILRAKIDTLAPGEQVFLRPLAGANDNGVIWQPYKKTRMGREDVGSPINSRSFVKFMKTKEEFSEEELLAIYSSKLKRSFVEKLTDVEDFGAGESIIGF